MTDDHAFPDREHAAERYLLGEMSEPDREKYEQHFFSCAECAEDVRTTAAFLGDVRTYVAPDAGTQSARWTRVTTLTRARPGRTLGSLFWPLPAGAAVAATLLIPVIGYQAVRVAGLRRDLTAEQRLQSVPSYFLPASRSEGPTISASSRQRKLGLTFSKSFDRSFRFYRCDIRDAAGRLVASEVLDAPPSGDELQVLVPADLLPPGAYRVAIAGLESASSTSSPLEPARYQFTLRREP
jgi:hypothetical protein